MLKKSQLLKIGVLVLVAVLLATTAILLFSCQKAENVGTGVKVNGVLVTKTSSHDSIRTVHPGEKVTYTFTLQNQAKSNKNIEIGDAVPAYTTYVGGDFKKDGDALSLKVTVPKGKTVTKSFTVSVTEDKKLLRKAVVTDSAKVEGHSLTCQPLYVAYTLNQNDNVKFAQAVAALKDSKFKGAELVKYMYYVAFSVSPNIKNPAGEILSQIFIDKSGESSQLYASMVVPGLYGGKSAPDNAENLFPAEKVTEITTADIQPGDLLCVLPSTENLADGRFYTTDGTKVYDVTAKCEAVEDTSFLTKLSENDLFAVLRPSMALESETSLRSEPLCQGETDVEKAIIATAEAFLMRGDRIQYADTRLAQSPITYRWERGKSPEDYTSDETGYSNCTGFVHDVYYNALGWNYGSFQLVNSPSAMQAYAYVLTHEETDQEKAAVEDEYKSQLQIGDIVFYTRSGNTHAMLYVGNGNIIHCSGSTYKDLHETEEPGIRYMQLDTLFDPTNSRYVFSTVQPRNTLYIIRPLNLWHGELPESSLSRAADMRGIFAEKTCSATLGQTVNPEDNLTYTFTIENRNDKSVTLDITDRIPDSTKLLEGNAISEKRTLEWTVELKPHEIKQISYMVQVSKNTKAGTAILCNDESCVGGIVTKAPPVFVGRTLTLAEQEKLREVVQKHSGSSLPAVELANQIYKEVLGLDTALGADHNVLLSALFTDNELNYTLNSTGDIAKMVAPSLYGGLRVDNSSRFMKERTRLPREKNLIVGDIIYLKLLRDKPNLYIYMGDGKLLDLWNALAEDDLDTRLQTTIGRQAFAILRPSLAAK